MSEKNLSKIEELSWVRIIDPYLIPTYLVEQIKERMFTVEKFYKYQEMICTKRENGNLIINPLNLLFVLADKDMVIKGFFWGVVDALANALVINSFSMDKEFWGEGKAVRLLQEKAREIKDGAQLDKVYWVTRCPKHSEKYGFKRSKHQLMEYKDGRNNDGEQCEAGGYRSTDDSAAATVPEYDIGTSRGAIGERTSRVA